MVYQSMCGVSDRLKPSSSSSSPSPTPLAPLSSEGNQDDHHQRPESPASVMEKMSNLTVETDDSFSSLLELAANGDLDSFQKSMERDLSAIDEIGQWYGRKKGSNQMVLQERTPLMVAATYGSLDVLKLILSFSTADVNRCCGLDGTTALHCAASGGSVNAVDVVKALLFAGAEPSCVDAHGHRPFDVISVSPRMPDVKAALEELLGNPASDNHQHRPNLRVSTSTCNSNSPPLSASPDEDGSPSSDSTSSPMMAAAATKFPDLSQLAVSEKKEYPVDPSLPDIKNSIYSTDEFRMFSFKVRPCSRAYSHDWTECPFVHPGENARRRDPRKFHYSCVPCPDFRKGACRRGDLCEYAHGVFECWLHPAQYRTRLCKDGTSCSRRVCFFAHTPEELRPLYVSTGSAVPSPRSTASTTMDMAAAMNLYPGSPSAVSVMSPTPFTPPMSPSANGMSNSSLAWPQPNVPILHLPMGNIQSSRLRSSLSARDIPMDDFSLLQDFDHQQLLGDLQCFSSNQVARPGSSAGNPMGCSKSLAPSNLDDLFSAEMSLSSPRYNSDQAAAFSASQKSAIMNQYQQHQQQSLLSPIKTNVYSPKAVDPQQLPGHSSLLQASFGLSSPGRMSPRSVEPVSPMSSRLAAAAAFAKREKQQQQLRSLSSRELGSNISSIVGSPSNSLLSKWGSPSGKLEWAVNGDELGRLRRSNSFELATSNGEEPDVSWVHSLVKESPQEIGEKVPGATSAGAPVAHGGGGGGNEMNLPMDDIEETFHGGWPEHMQFDLLEAP